MLHQREIAAVSEKVNRTKILLLENVGETEKLLSNMENSIEMELQRQKSTSILVPQEYRCPVSKKIMTDPVVIATTGVECSVGETLIPNKLVQRILTSCSDNVIDPEAYNSNKENESLSIGDLRLFSELKKKLSLSHSLIQSDAVKQLSVLIGQVPAVKVLLAESGEAVLHLVSTL
ncbi:U-box domain-containing protein 9-like [Salvia splendens]|uniref:U-box domain-containing protein 9-like n=1 Tax=Salvia splendens TaxID=180675 RepID=UPI001C274F30|nr:U-box domain-containing protein 9-like [Salvia splendens]